MTARSSSFVGMRKSPRLWPRQCLVSGAFCRERPQYAVNVLWMQWPAVVFPRVFPIALVFSSVIKGLTKPPGRDLKSLGRKAVRVRPPPSAPETSFHRFRHLLTKRRPPDRNIVKFYRRIRSPLIVWPNFNFLPAAFAIPARCNGYCATNLSVKSTRRRRSWKRSDWAPLHHRPYPEDR